MSRRALRHLAAQVRQAISASRPVEFEVPSRRQWRELGAALHAFTTAYVEREPAWRDEFLDALVQPALLFDDRLRLVAANAGARELFDISQTDTTLVQTIDVTALVDAVREVARTNEPIRMNLERGSRVLHATVARFANHILIVLVDRTREQQVEELRRNFVVNASHELKTPVTSIQTLADAIDVTLARDPDRAQSLVEQLRGEAERLSQLVTDLLDLRRLEERGPLDVEAVDVAVVCRKVLDEFSVEAEQRGITLHFEGPEHAVVAAMAADVDIVITNLVSNAVHYNVDQGKVTVSVQRNSDEVTVAVTDTGIGIPAADVPRIFERFYRVDAARSRATGGTGLGLSIVRHAVERHGGEVHVDSVIGRGTTFTVHWPVTAERA